MREKEFRVWDKDLKRMFYSAFSITSYGDVIDAGWRECVGVTEHGYYDHNMRGGVDCVVMQYTGLKAKNGEKIWEGDIISYSISKTQHFKGSVIWHDAGFSCNVFYQKHDKWAFGEGYEHTNIEPDLWNFGNDLFDIKIIGNICENPDIVV